MLTPQKQGHIVSAFHHIVPSANHFQGPYSHFRVGCAILTTRPENKIITGCNVENASYNVGTCAERVTLGTAVSMGLKLGDFVAIGVTTDIMETCSPCGMCRQFIREFNDNKV